MKKLLLLFVFPISIGAQAQAIDTLAFQDFENLPASPVWNYTGVLADVQSGNASPTACIPNTPLGIGSSQAWHVAAVSGGNPIVFDNQTIPPGYDSIRVNFRLAGLNLNGASGGPDNLDYVLVEYSLDNGATYVNRLRIRGATSNNSFWAYDATAIAAVPHLPATEAIYQPTSTGLQVADGFSFCEISFPGSISQLSVRITPRSSSTSDSWLVDNLVLTGEVSCSASNSNLVETACDNYLSPAGNNYTSTGSYVDIIPNAAGCDSIIDIDLTINNSSNSTDIIDACDSYTWINGTTYTMSNNVDTYTLTNSANCDSIVTIDLTINSSPDNTVNQTGIILTANQSGATYQWIDCNNGNAPLAGETSQSYTASTTGNYAVEVTLNGCTSTSNCNLIDFTSLNSFEGESKKVVKVTDFMGRETKFEPNTPLILIYEDGSIERIYQIQY